MFTFVAGFSSWPTWFATEGELASTLSPTKLSSRGGLGGNLEVSNFCNSAASDMGVFPPDCPGEDKFSTPVLSEMLSEETFIRREILTLGALINQKYQSVKKSLLKGWIRELARWSESRILIGYPSRQGGPPCPLGITRVGPASTTLFLAI